MRPRFPLPNDLIQDFENSHRFTGLDNIIAAWISEFADRADIMLVLPAIARMIQFINDTVKSPLFWQDIWFMTRRFLPIFQQLLSLPKEDLEKSSIEAGAVIREVVRLTCIVLLGIMNRAYGNSPDGIEAHRYEVLQILKNIPANWSSFLSLRLWVLVITGLVAEGGEREWLIREILSTMRQLELGTWDEALSTVQGIIWVDDIFEDEANKLGFEIGKFSSNIF
jgi:hypothetical protein